MNVCVHGSVCKYTRMNKSFVVWMNKAKVL